MTPTPHRNLIAGLVIAAAFTLTGCNGGTQAQPTSGPAITKPAIPTEEPTPTPTANVSANATSPEEAVAAAMTAYDDYLDKKLEIWGRYSTDPEEILEVATGAGGKFIQSSTRYSEDEIQVVGEYTYELMSSKVSEGFTQENGTLGPNSQAVLTTCVDTSGLKNLRRSGEQVERIGPKRTVAEVTTQWTPEAGRWLVVFEELPNGEVQSC